MRSLRDIRSDSVTLVVRPPAAAASIALVPFSVMLLLCWLGSPTWQGARPVVTAALAGVVLIVARLAWPRKRTLRIAPGSELLLETSLEGDDPYRVSLVNGSARTPLLEQDDPAKILADARRIALETSSTLVGPAWFAGPGTSSPWQAPSPLVTVTGPSSSGQLHTASATLGGALFTLVVFLVSVKAEAGVSLLSAALPLLSVSACALIGAALSNARVHATLGPDGLHVRRVLFGRHERLLDLAPDTILGVHAVGHAPFPERHVLVDTPNGPRAFLLAGEGARRLAEPVEPNRALQSESPLRTQARAAREPIVETSP